MYYYGQGVQQDHTEAVRWYRKAAEHGNSKAESALGSSYYYGQGVPRDYAEAVRWYRRAAELGNSNAEYSLAYTYSHGIGVPQDRAESNRLLRQAADQGNENARRVLGFKGRRLAPWNWISLSVTFLGSLLLLLGSLKAGQGPPIGSRQP